MDMAIDIAVIGGSGFYSLLKNVEEHRVSTRYGRPSDAVMIGKLGKREVAFIARHGRKHTIPPQRVPYRANIEALYQFGVKRIISTGAVGSLRPDYKPGQLAIFDQFVNYTHGRADTFYDDEVVAHVSTAEPYCGELRKIASKAAKNEKLAFHDSGTVAVISGPRFSTRAESSIFSSQGSHMINMTQYPEAALARERQMCYLGIGLITDYDAGLEGRSDIKPVSTSEVIRIFGKNVEKATGLILDIIPQIPEKRTCGCSKALEGAVITHK
ncbi:MAG: S-methyl-5'-thioadenosine phosphorylase [Candidatus Micrarchaeota archaeon]|nr:S-methyl-5'-thioadenosine phosphorylase [Candidatus Micrarchaeota archaeon]